MLKWLKEKFKSVETETYQYASMSECMKHQNEMTSKGWQIKVLKVGADGNHATYIRRK